jgi:hypothetical protein
VFKVTLVSGKVIFGLVTDNVFAGSGSDFVCVVSEGIGLGGSVG